MRSIRVLRLQQRLMRSTVEHPALTEQSPRVPLQQGTIIAAGLGKDRQILRPRQHVEAVDLEEVERLAVLSRWRMDGSARRGARTPAPPMRSDVLRRWKSSMTGGIISDRQAYIYHRSGAITALPLQHPAGIFRRQLGHGVQRGKVVRIE